MKRALFFAGIFFLGAVVNAQNLTEVTGLTFYEHHSSTVNSGASFGSGANGSQSGYDFVNHTYYNSFDPNTFGEYSNGEEANIDMVEHNGPFGGMGNDFGFTAGTSTIWGGEIKGNGTTRWVKASAGFNYAGATDVTELVTEYNAGTADSTVEEVATGDVYIGRIRNSNQYVAVNCSNVKNRTPAATIDDVYMEFDYKYGTVSTVGINENKTDGKVSIAPNPANDYLSVISKEDQVAVVKLYNVRGQLVQTAQLSTNKTNIDISSLPKGVYVLQAIADATVTSTIRLIKN